MKPEPVDIRGAIEEGNRGFMSTFAGGDTAAMAALYTENGQLFPSNSQIITGREPIASFWQQVMDMGIKTAMDSSRRSKQKASGTPRLKSDTTSWAEPLEKSWTRASTLSSGRRKTEGGSYTGTSGTRIRQPDRGTVTGH